MYNIMNSSTPEKCSCEKDSHYTQESDSSNSDSSTHKDSKKSKISLTSLGLHLRRGRSLQIRSKRAKKATSLSSSTNYCCTSDSTGTSNCSTTNNTNNIGCTSKKSTKWPLKFYCGKKEQKMSQQPTENQNCCKCTCYKRSEEAIPPPLVEATSTFDDAASSYKEIKVVESAVIEEVSENDITPIVENIVPENNVVEEMENNPEAIREEVSDNVNDNPGNRLAQIFVAPNFIDLHWRTIGQEDVDEEARIQRAREIERGVDPPPSFRPARRVQLFCSDENEGHILRRLQIVCPHDVTMDSLRAIFQNNVTFRSCPLDVIAGCHTQVDFIHCLVPDLLNITNCSFYWGKMDRYEAERLLDGKREGTFLLRDSAQEEFLFSVSFRKYGRSLHARIEQWNHKFSFDSHDPGVYTSDTVCGLIEHYKDPSSCMFFEPVLTWPLHRNFVFSLQHLCRASIVNRLTYDDVNQLQLPKSLKTYLKEYHYRQKVRVERFDDDVQWFELRNTST